MIEHVEYDSAGYSHKVKSNDPKSAFGEAQRCPTYGSDDRKVKLCGGGLREDCPHGHNDCPDSWHREVTK